MTRNEERASLIKQISNLHSRIECGRAENCRMWDDELALERLEMRLDNLKGDAAYARKPIQRF